jgi:protein-tyrosine phosphatase
LRGQEKPSEIRQIPAILNFPIPAANKKAAYLDSKKRQNAAVKSVGALKLDGISSAREPSEAKLKTTKLEQYSNVCSRIIPDLYLAGEAVASDKSQLQQVGITHVLNCAGTICPEYFPEEFQYKTLHLYDGKNEDISCFFLKVLNFITNALQENGSVLVHCQQGVSRSSAFVIMYLMWKHRKSFEETHKMVKQERGISNPNTGFIFQLLLWEKRLGLSSQSAYPWMVYIAPHSLNDPQEMVVRTVEAKFTSLDPRGVFLLQTAEFMFQWIGSLAHPALVSGSEEYLNYFLKFLRTENDFVRIKQGEETPEFCAIIGGEPGSPVPEKAQYTQYFDLLANLACDPPVSLDSNESPVNSFSGSDSGGKDHSAKLDPRLYASMKL